MTSSQAAGRKGLVDGFRLDLHVSRIGKVNVKLGIPQHEDPEIGPIADQKRDAPPGAIEVAACSPFLSWNATLAEVLLNGAGTSTGSTRPLTMR